MGGVGDEFPSVWLPGPVERALTLCRARGIPRGVMRAAKQEAAEVTRRLGVGPKNECPSCRELRAAVRAAVRVVERRRVSP